MAGPIYCRFIEGIEVDTAYRKAGIPQVLVPWQEAKQPVTEYVHVKCV